MHSNDKTTFIILNHFPIHDEVATFLESRFDDRYNWTINADGAWSFSTLSAARDRVWHLHAEGLFGAQIITRAEGLKLTYPQLNTCVGQPAVQL